MCFSLVKCPSLEGNTSAAATANGQAATDTGY